MTTLNKKLLANFQQELPAIQQETKKEIQITHVQVNWFKPVNNPRITIKWTQWIIPRSSTIHFEEYRYQWTQDVANATYNNLTIHKLEDIIAADTQYNPDFSGHPFKFFF